MSSRTKALLAIVFAAFLWGSAGVVAKILLTRLDPFVINFYRYLLASLVILPFFLKEKKAHLPWQTLILISLLTAFNVNLFYIGLQTTTANSAYLIGASVPLLTAFLAKFMIKEQVSMKKILGVLTGLSGALMIVILPAIEHGQMVSGDLTGNIVISVGVLLWAFYTIISRHSISTGKVSPLVFSAFNFFTTTGVSFLFAITTKQQFFSPGVLQPTYVLTLLYTAIMVTVVTYVLFSWAVQHIAATTASLKEYLQLFFGLLLNTLILGEAITAGLLVGGVLIIVGVSIATGANILREARGWLKK